MELHKVEINEIGLCVCWNDGDEVMEARIDGHVIDHILIAKHPHAQALEYAAGYAMSMYSKTVQ